MLDGMGDKLTNQQVLDADLADWRSMLHTLHTRFVTGDFATGLALVNAIAAAAEEANHHPDVDLRYGRVDVRLSSHDVGGVTQRDLDLATRISALAAEAGVSARPDRASVLELGLDTADAERIRPFWRAVFGLAPSDEADIEVVDPDGVVTTLWFQDTDEHETPRQRFHVDFWVPVDVAAGRIEEALAAGGALVDDSEAPQFTVLADADGNKVCICTDVGRGYSWE